MLDQAGSKRGAGRQRFSIRISYAGTGEGGALQSAAEIMREQLRDVGIELVLEPKDYAVWMEGAHLKWDFDLSMGSYQTGPDPGHRRLAALHHQEHSEDDGPQPDGLQQPEGRRIVRRRRSASSIRQKRVKLYHEVQDILADEVPALWLWDRLSTLAHRSTRQGRRLSAAPIWRISRASGSTDGK